MYCLPLIRKCKQWSCCFCCKQEKDRDVFTDKDMYEKSIKYTKRDLNVVTMLKNILKLKSAVEVLLSQNEKHLMLAKMRYHKSITISLDKDDQLRTHRYSYNENEFLRQSTLIDTGFFESDDDDMSPEIQKTLQGDETTV